MTPGDSDVPVPTAVTRFRHEALAVVLQVRDGRLCVLLWARARAPYEGDWALPSGPLEPDETLGAAVARHLAARAHVTWLPHLEQLETRSEPTRDPYDRTVATAYLGLLPLDASPPLPEHAGWHAVDALPALAFDHASVVRSAVERLRSKLSYTNIAFALAPPTFTMRLLRTVYVAALGRDVSATNLRRVLTRHGQLVETGQHAPPTRSGGRPASVYRFAAGHLEVTDPFAVLRPAGESDR